MKSWKERIGEFLALIAIIGGGFLWAMDKGGERQLVTDQKIEGVSGALVTYMRRDSTARENDRRYYSKEFDDIDEAIRHQKSEIAVVKSLSLAASDDPAKRELLHGILEMRAEVERVRERQETAISEIDRLASAVPDTIVRVIETIDTVKYHVEEREDENGRKWYYLWVK